MTEIIKVWIQGNCWKGDIIKMLYQYNGSSGPAAQRDASFRQAKSVKDSDMILYTGGADVSPLLYGEPILVGTYVDRAQDKADTECFREAASLDKFQVGICRGSQFLNVMNGGKLWQNIDAHAGTPHLVQDCITKKVFEVSSFHHQGSILNSPEATLLAFCNEATRKESPDGHWILGKSLGPSVDVEAFWYEKTKCLGVQWHPEAGCPQEGIDWFFYYLNFYRKSTDEILKAG